LAAGAVVGGRRTERRGQPGEHRRELFLLPIRTVRGSHRRLRAQGKHRALAGTGVVRALHLSPLAYIAVSLLGDRLPLAHRHQIGDDRSVGRLLPVTERHPGLVQRLAHPSPAFRGRNAESPRLKEHRELEAPHEFLERALVSLPHRVDQSEVAQLRVPRR
jgi:hypothetical protein